MGVSLAGPGGLSVVLVTYATWPSCGSLPGYLKAADTAMDYPGGGTFAAMTITSTVPFVPAVFPPFTEPALALFIAGLFVVAREFLERKERRLKLALIAVWFFGPFGAAVILRPTMYDNFRHFLFLCRPVHLCRIALIGYEQTRFGDQYLLVAAIILPGMIWGFKLHPYQYVYYNQLVGGVSGAFRRYEADYWVTSYKEAAEYLNAYAPPGSRVVVWGADHIVEHYGRGDLVISDYRKESRDSDLRQQDFAVISSRHSKDLSLYSDAPVVFQARREGAIFVVVKRLSPQDAPQP
jgi:hypothetical protein